MVSPSVQFGTVNSHFKDNFSCQISVRHAIQEAMDLITEQICHSIQVIIRPNHAHIVTPSRVGGVKIATLLFVISAILGVSGAEAINQTFGRSGTFTKRINRLLG